MGLEDGLHVTSVLENLLVNTDKEIFISGFGESNEY
jgi:hypothetical protein